MIIKQPKKFGATRVTIDLTQFGFPADLPDIAARIAAHGIQQKAADSVAAPQWQGDEGRARWESVLDNLRAGIWSLRGERGGESWHAFITRFLVATAKAQDKKKGTEDTKEGYAKRAAAALENPALASLIATKRAEWEVLQTEADDEIEI